MNRTALLSEVGKTNRRYTDEEKQIIHESTCRAKEALRLLLEEKQAITRREEDLRSEIECGLIALAPIKWLSDDVLCYIFQIHCQDSLTLTLPLNNNVWSRDAMPPQITISHVCATWRQITLSVPTFWSDIKLAPQQDRRIDKLVKVANSLLSRAKDLPCSLEVENDWSNPMREKIVKDLIPLHKFKKLSFPFRDHHLRRFLQLPDDKLSSIEDLSLHYASSKGDDTSLLNFHKLSNLTSFSLLPDTFLGGSFNGYSRFVGIPWHNLRRMVLHTSTPAQFCLDALQLSAAVLETCSLVIAGDNSLTTSSRKPIHIPELRDLKLVVYPQVQDKDVLGPFIHLLRFPKLASLTLGCPDDPPIDIDLQTLLKMDNALHLEKLIISQTIHTINVLDLLRGFPSLRCLELPEQIIFDDDAMREVGEGSIGVFLERLTINDPDLDVEKLLQMVKARSPARKKNSTPRAEATPFKSVFLCSNDADDHVADEIWDTIEEINNLGVELAIDFQGYSDDELYGRNDYSDESYDEDVMYGDYAW